MAISRTFPLYLNPQNPDEPLLVDASSYAKANHMVLTQGDKFTLRLYFVQTPGSSPVFEIPDETDTIVLAAKKTLADTTPTFLISSWTWGEDYIEATFDAGVASGFWVNASQTNRILTCDVEVRDASNEARITYQFPIRLRRQVYGGETAPGTITPYLDLASALNIFLAHDRSQSLDTEAKDQVAANAGLLRSDTQTLTPAQQSLVRANFSAGLATLTGNSAAPYISQTAMADIPIAEGSVTSSPCTATGLFPGMEVNTPDVFTPGTTIESISGVAPNQTVTFSDPALVSGTSTITASFQLAISTFNPASPGTIGGTTPGAATFTTLNVGSGTAKFSFTTTTLTQTNASGVQVLRTFSDGRISTYGGLDLVNNATTQGIYSTYTGITGQDASDNPTFALYSASGAATLTGDLWLGDWSGTGQGILISRTGLFGYRADGGNTIVLDPDTGDVNGISYSNATGTFSVTPDGAVTAKVSIKVNLDTVNGDAGALHLAYSDSVPPVASGCATIYAVQTGTAIAFKFTDDNIARIGINNSINRDYQLPDASGTFSLIDATETLLNKTLVAPALGTPSSGNLSNCTPATASVRGVVREWCRTGNIQLSNLTETKAGTASATVTTPVGYSLQSGTTSTTGYAARRAAPSNNVPYFEGLSAGVIPWASRTIEGEVLLIMETGWDAGAVFRLHVGRTNAFPTGATAHASHPQSFEIRYSLASALVVVGARAASTTAVTSSFTPTLGTSFRLRWVVSGGTILIYVNGNLVATNTGGPNVNSSSTANVFHIGVENGTVSASSEVKSSIPVLDIY